VKKNNQRPPTSRHHTAEDILNKLDVDYTEVWQQFQPELRAYYIRILFGDRVMSSQDD